MNDADYLKGHEWKHPAYYAGFSPDGDYLIVTQHRESGTICRSNYTCVFKELRKVCEGLDDPPEERLEGGFMQARGELSPRSSGWVYDFRTRCSMVGWIEYLLVRKDAPIEVLNLAGKIIHDLNVYPIFNEDHQSELEWSEAEAFWAGMSITDRLHILKGAGVSHFAARHDYIPQDPQGYVFESLRG